jgi:predicted deacylase
MSEPADATKAAWHDAAAGRTTVLHCPVTARPDGSQVTIPVIVLAGAQPGPTLLVSAGVHGDEFEGIVALQTLAAQLSPAELRGTFVAVPVVNMPAYAAGLRVNPDGRQDLARVFPGDRRGTVTEQIAYVFTQRLIRHADFYCDLHSAGQYYAIEPWVGYQLKPELLPRQREAAALFGLPTVWGTPYLPGRTLSAAAQYNVPSLYAEVTGEGRCRDEDVAALVHGVRQLLAWLGITSDPPRPHRPLCVVEDDRPDAGYLQGQLRAACGGLFRPAVRLGQQVKQGELFGTIAGPVGETMATATVPASGRVVFLRTFPRVVAGDPLGTVMETPPGA